LEPASAKPLLGLACVHEEYGQLDEAVRLLREAHERDAADPSVAFGIAFVQERMEDITSARHGYEQTIEMCPQLRNAYERLAAIAIRQGDWEAAIGQYERLASMEPGDLDVLLTLGGLCLQADRPIDAIDHYQQALFIEPQGEGPFGDDEEPDSDERVEERIATLRKLVSKYPTMAPFRVQLGDLYVKAGRDDEAIEEYRAALDSEPSFLEATVKLGTQHMRKGRLVDAALIFNRAVELNDRLITAFVGLGVAQHACGREQESAATLDLAASLEPSSTLLFSETARLHVQSEGRRSCGDIDLGGCVEDLGVDALGNDVLIDEAVRRHRQALIHAPGQADLHYRYGLLLRQVGQQQPAIDSFRRAIAISPDYCKAQMKLAICLKESNRTEEAIAAFEQALRLDLQRIEMHYHLGLLFAQRSQFDLAIEAFEDTIGDQTDDAFRANLALALQNIGMIDRAAATWRSICDLSREHMNLLSRREHILRESESDID